MRRTAPQALLATAMAIALLAGCAPDGSPESTSTTSSAAPTGSTASASQPAGSPSPDATQVIRSSALLQPEDLGGATLEPMPQGDSEHLRPVRPCGERYPSDETRTAAVAMRAHVSPGENETPRVVLQYVGLHPGHGAAAFDEIAAALRRCPGSLESGKHRWEVAGTGIAGDESLLVRVSARFSYGDEESVTTTPAVLARVGDHIMVLADLGWENASGTESYVRRLAPKAVERLRAAQ
ncbi:hypothetical protein ACN28C_18395 [Plantactinospora sp. WMMC1484]|uniref:hypothetical protein n=1 Tax=Plantactinospora sp. WMMC1484 TaxID=3404122 RepID=UPI003BF5D8BC